MSKKSAKFLLISVFVIILTLIIVGVVQSIILTENQRRMNDLKNLSSEEYYSAYSEQERHSGVDENYVNS